MEFVRKTYKLTADTCDEISALVTDFCNSVCEDHKEVLRYRLSAEESMLSWMQHGMDGAWIRLQMGRFFGSPFIQLEAEGPAYNPYVEESEEYGEYSVDILVRLGLSPEYSYQNGKNRIRYKVRKKPVSQGVQLCLVIAAAFLVGIFGRHIFSEAFRAAVLSALIEPLYNTFFNILGCIAGPMIFLSVAWGIYGIGDAATFGRIGKKMILQYVGIVLVSSACGALFFPLLGPGIASGSESGGQLSSLAELLLGIFPSTIVEPFATGNTLQIIYLAIVVGIALLYLGRQTSSVARAIEQVNLLVQFLMEVISRLVPFVIFLVLINIIWSDSLSVLASVWKLMAALAAAFAAAGAVFTLLTAVRLRVQPLILVRKSMPAFLVALTTASSAAAFGKNVAACEEKFGIDPSLIRFGIPLGMVMHRPIAAIYNLLLVFFFAARYDVNCSISWILAAVFFCAVVAISTPPIPGGGAVAYTILFLQFGIPEEALAIALAIDIISDFLITSFEVYTLPMSLIRISYRLGLIDTEKLRAA